MTSYPFSQDSITLDLTLGKEKPLWPLSSYGPAKNEPNVISGLDISSEELRFNAWEAKAKNDLNGYIQYEADRIGNADAAFNVSLHCSFNSNLAETLDIERTKQCSSTTPASSKTEQRPLCYSYYVYIRSIIIIIRLPFHFFCLWFD